MQTTDVQSDFQSGDCIYNDGEIGNIAYWDNGMKNVSKYDDCYIWQTNIIIIIPFQIYNMIINLYNVAPDALNSKSLVQ